MFLPTGKVPPDLLDRMLKTYASGDASILVGPSVGEDAAVLDVGGTCLIAKSDPITFVTEDIGIYTIHINANDIAVMGGTPRWLLTTILLPEKNTDPELVEDIFRQLSSACRKGGISLCGGHTEVTAGIDRPIVVGMMLGEVDRNNLIVTAGAKIGDDILVTKGIAIEGISLIAREKGRELTALFGEDFVRKCREFIERPGISIVREAETAVRCGGVHSMHDPTEGGLATGLREIARAAAVGLMVDGSSIPVFKECQQLCRYYGVDPLGLIASGALLLTANADATERILNAFGSVGISASRIGKVVPRDQGLKMKKGSEIVDLPDFDRDEITKILCQPG